MLANCTERAYALNKSRMVPIAEYSRDCMKALRAETGIAYDERTQGTLQLFRTQKQLDGTAQDIEVLKQYGVPYEVLDRAGFVSCEPALALTQHKFVGALRLPGDETGDCFKFTSRLAEMAQGLGVTFRYGTRIEGLDLQGGEVTGVRTDAGHLQADRVVVALGSHSPPLLKPLGLRIPVYPVKGYSITVPISDAKFAPESTIMDETPQGRGDTAGRSHPRRRHRRTRRLQPGAARGPPRHAEPCRQRPVPATAATCRRPASGAACGR